MEVPRHWWLALRTSIIGAIIGMVPGLGGSAAAWLCYGHAVQSSKTPERFGHGAVEGVIAPETASNAKEGGSLLPTLFFGIPGSSGMAVMMGAFLILGIQPGPAMITQHLDLVWTLIWALVVGNLIAVTFLLFITRWVAVLTFINASMLVPFIIVLVVIGAFVNEGQWENLVILVAMSAVGYGLLRANWPRAPFVIGLVLGRIAEESLHKALDLWGFSFFLRPLSLVLISMIVATVAFAIYKSRRPSVSTICRCPHEHGAFASIDDDFHAARLRRHGRSGLHLSARRALHAADGRLAGDCALPVADLFGHAAHACCSGREGRDPRGRGKGRASRRS